MTKKFHSRTLALTLWLKSVLKSWVSTGLAHIDASMIQGQSTGYRQCSTCILVIYVLQPMDNWRVPLREQENNMAKYAIIGICKSVQ